MDLRSRRPDLFDRAVRAWVRYCDANGFRPDQPIHDDCVDNVNGRDRITLENMHGVLAIYEETPSGRIRRVSP